MYDVWKFPYSLNMVVYLASCFQIEHSAVLTWRDSKYHLIQAPVATIIC